MGRDILFFQGQVNNLKHLKKYTSFHRLLELVHLSQVDKKKKKKKKNLFFRAGSVIKNLKWLKKN